MANIYFTYRPIWDNKTSKYNVSYYNKLMFKDYYEAGLTNMIDGNNFIPENRITKEVVPGVKWERRAGVLIYDDNLDGQDVMNTLQQTASTFAISIKTPEEMYNWITENTDLKELDKQTDDDGNFVSATFEIYPEHEDESGNTVPAKTLVIE